MKKAAVIGYPIKHSLSPKIHGFWLKQYGIEGEYSAIEVAPDDLGSFVQNLSKEGFAGINVTLPHKEKIMPFIDEIEPLSKAIGAVNTVIVGEDGKTIATNTDVGGFFENIAQGAPDVPILGGKAVVLGAGGAAKAIVAGLLICGVPSVTIVNRTISRAEDIREFIRETESDDAVIGEIDWPALADKIHTSTWEEADFAISDASFLINTTSMGMIGQPELELELETLPHHALVTDIVYNPLETFLLKRARARGNPVVDGLGMLLYQAVPGFEAWFGVRPEVTPELRAHVEQALREQ
jgi:shikimate dehydrogenase